MEAIFSELPLALFSTLAPCAAGAYFFFALSFSVDTYADTHVKKINKLTWVPFIVLALAVICAFFHLANMSHSFQVFNNIGSSPLSNELLACVIFGIVALIYCACASSGKLARGAQKAFLWIVGIVGIIFAYFIGAAYMIHTIPTWDSAWVPVQLIAYALLGGACLAEIVLMYGQAGSLSESGEGAEGAEGVGASGASQATSDTFKKVCMGVLVVGFILALVGLCGQVMGAASIENAVTSGALAVSAAMPLLIASIICLLIACVCGILAANKNMAALGIVAFIFALIGIFLARMVFYSLQLSVGIYLA